MLSNRRDTKQALRDLFAGWMFTGMAVCGPHCMPEDAEKALADFAPTILGPLGVAEFLTLTYPRAPVTILRDGRPGGEMTKHAVLTLGYRYVAVLVTSGVMGRPAIRKVIRSRPPHKVIIATVGGLAWITWTPKPASQTILEYALDTSRILFQTGVNIDV